MKSRTDSQSSAEYGSVVGSGTARGARAGSAPSLSGDEQLVFECLQGAASGLTLHQVQVRIEGPVADPAAVLERLVEQRLVSRLNTLIPTYVLRNRDAGADAE